MWDQAVITRPMTLSIQAIFHDEFFLPTPARRRADIPQATGLHDPGTHGPLLCARYCNGIFWRCARTHRRIPIHQQY